MIWSDFCVVKLIMLKYGNPYMTPKWMNIKSQSFDNVMKLTTKSMEITPRMKKGPKSSVVLISHSNNQLFSEIIKILKKGSTYTIHVWMCSFLCKHLCQHYMTKINTGTYWFYLSPRTINNKFEVRVIHTNIEIL